MADDRETLLARAQLLQKAASLRDSKKVTSPQPSAPEDYAGNASAALQGYGQGATLGYMPQIQAAVEPTITKVGDLVTGQDNYADLPDYAHRRDQWSNLQQKLAESHPKYYVGGQLAGGLATGLAIPGSTLAKGVGMGAKVAAQVATGAAMRAVQNPGDQQGVVDPLQLSERAQSVANPTALAIDTAVPFAAPALKYAGGKLSDAAENSAFSALGPYARQVKQQMSKENIKNIGRQVLDSNAFGWLPKSYEGLANRLSALKTKAGEKLGSTVEQMAQKESSMEGSLPIGVSREQLANDLEKQIVSPDVDLAGVPARNAKMQENLSQFKRAGLESEAQGPLNDNLPLLQAELKKRAVGKEVNWDRLPGADIPVDEQFNRALYGKLAQGVEDKGEELAAKTGFDVDKFKDLKNQYGSLAAAESISKNKASRELANRMISPSDYGVGATGAMVGAAMSHSPEEAIKHGVYGALLGVANNVARKYGSQTMARGFNNASKAADLLSQGANNAAISPVATQAVLNQPIWQTLYKRENKK